MVPYYSNNHDQLVSSGFAFHDLPRDLVVEILSRLPAKCVLRFKCVCKAWRRLIKSPAFAHKHFVNHKKNYKLLVYGWTLCESEVRRFYALPSPDDPTFDPLHLPFGTGYNSVRVLGSANGIVCLSQYPPTTGRDFTLWNPATGEYRLIPAPPVPLYSFWGSFSSVGFAFLDNGFTLISLTSKDNHGGKKKHDDLYGNKNCVYVEKFSLCKNHWESSTKMLNFSVTEKMKSQCVRVKEYLHWLAKGVEVEEGGGEEIALVSFDMIQETFGEPTKLPPHEASQNLRIVIQVFKETELALFVYRYGEQESAEMWLTNSRGGPDWTRQWIVEAPGGSPVGFWFEEVIFMPYKQGMWRTSRWEKALIYNPANTSFRRAPLLEGPFCVFPLATHLHTLLPIQ